MRLNERASERERSQGILYNAAECGEKSQPSERREKKAREGKTLLTQTHARLFSSMKGAAREKKK